VAKTVFDVLIDKFEEHIKSHTDFIASGRAAEFAAYKEQCGVIRGLNLALRDVQDLAQNFMDERDD
jgi:hypothetical protein